VNPTPQAEDTREKLEKAASIATDPIDDLPLPYIEMDAFGVVTRANSATMALHPPERGELVGKMVWDFMAADEKDPSFAAYCSTMEAGAEPEVVRRSLYDRSGQFRTYELYRKLMRDERGAAAGMRVIFVDVTEQVKALDEAHRTRLWLESIMESVCEAVIVTDSVGFIRKANPAADKLLRASPGELAGMLIEEGLPITACAGGNRSELQFTSWLEASSRGAATVLDRERKEIQVELSTSPIFDKETRSTTGVVYILRTL
jgi:PAS domain S-box-containing protein